MKQVDFGGVGKSVGRVRFCRAKLGRGGTFRESPAFRGNGVGKRAIVKVSFGWRVFRLVTRQSRIEEVQDDGVHPVGAFLEGGVAAAWEDVGLGVGDGSTASANCGRYAIILA